MTANDAALLYAVAIPMQITIYSHLLCGVDMLCNLITFFNSWLFHNIPFVLIKQDADLLLDWRLSRETYCLTNCVLVLCLSLYYIYRHSQGGIFNYSWFFFGVDSRFFRGRPDLPAASMRLEWVRHRHRLGWPNRRRRNNTTQKLKTVGTAKPRNPRTGF